MTFRPPKDSAIRAVHALAREATELTVPHVDWERVEQRLFARLGEIEKPTHSLAAELPPREPLSSAPALGRGSVWTVALAAAAAALLVAGARHGESGGPSSGLTAEARVKGAVRGITLGDSLELGGVVASKTRPLAYEKPGLVTFTLAPSSRIELVAADQDGVKPGALTIALTEGSVHAEVQPQADGEAFAIEVEHTRVAVHGTSFTATREADRVIVEVAHGSVAVGPTGYRGSTQGWLLVGPDRASFSLDGGRDAQWLGAPPSLVAEAPARAHQAQAGALDAAPSSDPGAGRFPTQAPVLIAAPAPPRGARATSSRTGPAGRIPDQGASLARAQEALGRARLEQDEAAKAAITRGLESCYQRQGSSFGVSVSIVSSLSLSILPNGSVREGLFTPPLSPTLMNCARDAITSARFPAGDSVREVHVPVHLARR